MLLPERRLCDEVHLTLAYRWFCRLGLDGDVPDHSTLSKNRHGRFRDSDLLRRQFETTFKSCMTEGLVGGDGFAVDASLVRADDALGIVDRGLARLPGVAQIFISGSRVTSGSWSTVGGVNFRDPCSVNFKPRSHSAAKPGRRASSWFNTSNRTDTGSGTVR